MDPTAAILESLEKIYGPSRGRQAYDRILPLLDAFPARPSARQHFFSEKDVVLITYGDTLQSGKNQAPLETLAWFAQEKLKTAFSTIHFLPFYPYSSDDGFSVIDFFAINPDLGSWEHVHNLEKHFELMFDFVLNHISSQSDWFARYLAEEEGYRDLAISVDPGRDLSQVTRPRSLPLLTEYRKQTGEPVWVWTTFSADQIDLNFDSIDVLEKMIQVLLYYVQSGARMVRMDAIAYLWKEIGTSCIHLPQTHEMVKLFRKVLDRVAPDVIILTETNVPHDENISYFGNGRDEAQMVYNFTLPPLLFYSFVNQNVSVLSEWAGGLQLSSPDTTFFNFTASHDGIGVRPLEGILPAEELTRLIEIVEKNGGKVSYKQNSDGSESPYELNITYVDALRQQTETGLDPDHPRRFLASQAIMMVLPGVPAVYVHSLLGSRNWLEGVAQTGRSRTINRQKLDVREVLDELADPKSFRAAIFFPYIQMIQTRRKQPAFHPNAEFEILTLHESVFAIRRMAQDQAILALINVSDRAQTVVFPPDWPSGSVDLIRGTRPGDQAIQLAPYQYVWLAAECA